MSTAMTTSMPWVTIVIVLALAAVHRLRHRRRPGPVASTRWPRPAITGNEVFERYFRVQMNTLELLVVFVPAIWLFALQVSATWAAGLGAVYLVGRMVYLRSYIRDPKSRSLGFGLSMLPILIMLVGVLVVAIARLSGTASRLNSITTMGSIDTTMMPMVTSPKLSRTSGRLPKK